MLYAALRAYHPQRIHILAIKRGPHVPKIPDAPSGGGGGGSAGRGPVDPGGGFGIPVYTPPGGRSDVPSGRGAPNVIDILNRGNLPFEVRPWMIQKQLDDARRKIVQQQAQQEARAEQQRVQICPP